MTFTIYIDPSGLVVDGANGNAPISGATVTLLSSDSLAGTFTPVPSGSAVMSPGNRTNPDTSRADGSFGWDTVPGFYEVEASKSGCGSTTSAAFEVPPPMTDLQLVLNCATTGAATAIATSLSGGGQSGISVTVPSGTAVTDTAVLTGTEATTATGTVTYDVFTNSTCTALALSGAAQTITTPGSLPASAAVTFTTPGTYYWQASYSGDANNAPTTSTCGTGGEVETATPAPTSLQLHISAPYQDNGVTVVSLWWTAPPGATTFTLTDTENTGLGPYSYPDTGLPLFTQGSPFIVQVEGATPVFSETFQVTDNLGDASNAVSYP